MSEEWTLLDDYWWDSSTDCIRFKVYNDGDKYSVSISQETICDFFGEDDDSDIAFDLFVEHKDSILNLAAEYIQSKGYDYDSYIVSSSYFEQNFQYS